MQCCGNNVEANICVWMFFSEPEPKEFFDKKIEIESPPLTDYDILPETLEEACKILRESEVLKKHLGKVLVEGFATLKEREVKEYRKNISQWEIAIADDY